MLPTFQKKPIGPKFKGQSVSPPKTSATNYQLRWKHPGGAKISFTPRREPEIVYKQWNDSAANWAYVKSV